MSPRESLRFIFGLYEHELNNWISQALPRVDKVLDLGANAGYFTFGCAAALRRLRKTAEIHAFEPDAHAIDCLKENLAIQPPSQVSVHLHPLSVTGTDTENSITLNSFARDKGSAFVQNALVKIDVEGAEVEVINAASEWLNPTNYFVIEVHEDKSYLDILRGTFANRNLTLNQINQQPLPIIGREGRGVNLWWLVSAL
jgi:tRNA1(Val) A37 N6-methylase TrmN6